MVVAHGTAEKFVEVLQAGVVKEETVCRVMKKSVKLPTGSCAVGAQRKALKLERVAPSVFF